MKKFTFFLLLTCLMALKSNAQCFVEAYFSYFNTGQAYFYQDESSGTDNSTTYLWTFGDGQTSTEQNPSHTYDSVGTYVVCETVTDADISNCSNQYCYTIAVCNITPAFTYSNPSPYNFVFNDNSTGEDTTVTFYWTFGDDSTSYDQNPTHTFVPDAMFTSVDSYYVCLNLYSSECSAYECQEVYLNCPVMADFTYTNSTPYKYSFTDASTGEDNTTTYVWNFGDGDSSTSQSPTHTYAAFGTYSVCLTVTDADDSCNNQVCYTINVQCPTQASFTESASGLYDYSFVNTTTGADNSATYTWSFGDGDSSMLQSPAYNYDTVGSYNVCLFVNDPNQGCSNQSCSFIEVLCPGSALYSYYVDTNGLTYNFQDNSTGENDSTTFLWNFGDSDTGSAQNPVHTYTNAGNYNVCLTVDNVSLGCSNQFCTPVAVCPVITAFTYTNTNIYSYQFTDISTGEQPGDTYTWAFGDGDTAYVQNPQHVFASQGGYTVCLTVTSAAAGCSNTYCISIYISCPASAGYVYAIDTNGYTYNFTDISFGEDTSSTYLWNFGDGDSSTLQNPAHTFDSSGNYNVCLTINDADDACSSQSCNLVPVCRAVAFLTYTVTNTFTYNFSDASSGESNTSSYAWDFGDGYTSTVKNPRHTFAGTGFYYVCLTVTDSNLNCNNQYCAQININCPAAANFTYTDSAVYTVLFADASTGEDTSSTFYWDFNDGNISTERNPRHTYASAGDYLVCFTVTDDDLNCSNSYCANIAICPSSASFGYSSTSLYTYQFNDSSAGESASTVLSWDFGDNTTSQQQNPQHTFASAGTYYVCLTLNDTILNCYTQYCTAVSVACPDTADFIYYPINGWENNFEDISVGEDSTTSFSWSFGDGATATNQLPTHKFESSGIYSVCLTIVNNDNSCSSQFCTNVVIACADTASYTYSDSSFILSFQNNSAGADDSVTYLWEFGDGTSSALQNPVHAYTAPNDNYRVCLTIDNADEPGCTNTACTNIALLCQDTAFFNYVIFDSSFTFVDQSTGEISRVSYHWDFGDGDTSDAAEPTHVYRASGFYLVCMTINERSIGCSSESCDTVQASGVGINQVSMQDLIKLYPNPTSGKVNIDMGDLVAGQIQIFNNLGQQVLSLEPQKSGIIPVDVMALSAGIYNVRIAVKGSGIANIKMVISY